MSALETKGNKPFKQKTKQFKTTIKQSNNLKKQTLEINQNQT